MSLSSSKSTMKRSLKDASSCIIAVFGYVVYFYYFSRNTREPITIVEELRVTKTGELIGGLKGFFEHG